MSSQAFSQNEISEAPVSLVTHNRDTLFLINDNTGKLIASAWETPAASMPAPGKEKDKKPVIVFVTEADMKRMMTMPRYRRPN